MPVTSFTYSTPYIIFLLYLVVLCLLEFRMLKFGQDIKYIRLATITGFLFFFGLRGYVFTDWLIYYPIFDKMPTIWDGGLFSVMDSEINQIVESDVELGKAGYEIGFVYFTYFFKSIIPNYFVWIFFNVLIDVILLDVFFRRYSSYYVLGFIFFVAMGGLLIECNLVRNIKAILIFLCSLKYLQERRIIPYMALNILGYLFHSSALIYMPLYFFLHKECPKWLMWAIFIVGNIITLLHIGYLQPIMIAFSDIIGGRLAVQIKLYFALDRYSQAYGISIGYIERVITYLLILFFQNQLIQKDRRNILFINAYIIYFIVFFFFSEVMIAVERLTLMFIFSYWILYPELYSLIKSTSRKYPAFAILISFCVLKTATSSSNFLAKYDNLLFGIESYDVREMNHDNNVDAFLVLDDKNL